MMIEWIQEEPSTLAGFLGQTEPEPKGFGWGTLILTAIGVGFVGYVVGSGRTYNACVDTMKRTACGENPPLRCRDFERGAMPSLM